MEADGRKTPVMRLARRAVAGKDGRKTMAAAAQGIARLEIAALLAGMVERWIHGAPDQAVAVNGLSEAIFKPASSR